MSGACGECIELAEPSDASVCKKIFGAIAGVTSSFQRFSLSQHRPGRFCGIELPFPPHTCAVRGIKLIVFSSPDVAHTIRILRMFPLSCAAAAFFCSYANLCQSWKCRSFKKKLEENGNEPKFRGGVSASGNGAEQSPVKGGGGVRAGKFVVQVRFTSLGVTTPAFFRTITATGMRSF